MPGLTNQIALLRNALAGLLSEEAINALFGLLANCGLSLNHRGRFNIEFNSDTVKSPNEALAALTITSNGVLINNEFHGAPAVNINGPVNHNGIALPPPRSRFMYRGSDFGFTAGLQTPEIVPLIDLDPLLHKPPERLPRQVNDWADSGDGKGAKLPEDGIYCYHILATGGWDEASAPLGAVNLVTMLTVNGNEYARVYGTLGAVEKVHDGYVKNVQWEMTKCNLSHSGIFAGLRDHEVHLWAWADKEEQTGAWEVTRLMGEGKFELGLSLHQISSGIDAAALAAADAAGERPFPPP